MPLVTAEAIRDQILSLIEALTPSALPGDKFRRYRNEGSARFDDWAQENAAAAFRRVQAREVSEDGEPDVSNTDLEAVEMDVEIRIGYPQSNRYGAANGMDRDDVRKLDWKQIKHTIGAEGRANFSGSHDCTPLGASMVREEAGGVDIMVITARFRYHRSTT